MPKIALVDDEQSILTSVSLALEQDGFEVDTFLNGEDALTGFENKKYDLATQFIGLGMGIATVIESIN